MGLGIAVGAVVACLVLATACGKSQSDSGKPAKTDTKPPTSSPGASPSGAPSSQPTTPRVTPAGASVDLGGLTLSTIPETWQPQALTSPMRHAQWNVAPVNGDDQPAKMAVFRFGKGGGGPVDRNVKRWLGQFESEDGKPIDKSASITKKTQNGLSMMFVEVGGRYRAKIRPGGQQRHNKPGYRMIAVIIETAKWTFFFKLLGPKNTVVSVTPEFRKVIDSAVGS